MRGRSVLMAGMVFAAPLAAVAQTGPEATALTQTAATAGVIRYPASFYASQQPSTAREMVERTPGFVLDRGEGGDVRGYAGAGGNVLIDGQRPTSKSVDLETILGRISVGDVERIEVIRGGAPGIDMQGQSVVANVVRRAGGSTGRAAHLFAKQYLDGFSAHFVRGELTTRGAGYSAEGQISHRRDVSGDTGDGSLSRRRDGAAAPFESGAFDGRNVTEALQVNAAGEYDPGVGVLRLNAAGERERINRRETGRLSGLAGAVQEETRVHGKDDQAELGADYERPLAESLTLDALVLQRLERETTTQRSAAPRGTQASRERADTREGIARVALRSTHPWGELEGGAEGALNRLKAASSLVSNGQAVALPSANVRVEETRGEAFATLSLRPRDDLSFEAGLRYETSTIRQTGGANQEKTLSFAKPRLVVSWSRGATQAGFRIERTVGQLDFDDFAASAELEADTVNAGNADLEPERAWEAEVNLEQRFGPATTVSLTLTHAEVDEAVDLIPIAGRFDGPGNIGSGVRDEAQLAINSALDPFGLKSANLRFTGTWRRSSVTDPVTGEKRRISGQRPFEGEMEITQPIPQWRSTLGVEAEFGFEETFYRINEIRRVREGAVYKLFWDWTPRPNLLMRFQAENLTMRERTRSRTVFDGPRSAGRIAFRERRTTDLAPMVTARARVLF